MEEQQEKTSIMPPQPPYYNEMHQMGLRLVEMGLELLRNGMIYPPYEPYNAVQAQQEEKEKGK
jgi:hypothetical protein